MSRVIRSEAELSRLLERPGYAVREQFGGEVVNTESTLPPVTGNPVTPATLTLPWPPSGQHSHGHHGSRRYLLPEVIAYRDAVANLCADVPPVKGPYKLHIHLSPPDKRRRDADNAIKSVLDAVVKGGYIEDDAISYMRELWVTTDADRYGWVKVWAEAL